MGPDCTDIFLNMGFRFCFTSAVMSPGHRGGQGSPRCHRSAPGGWAAGVAESETHPGLCAVLGKPIRLIALTSLPRDRHKRAAEALRIGFANLLSFNSSTVYSS